MKGCSKMKDCCLLSDVEIREKSSGKTGRPLIENFISENAVGGSYILCIGTVHKPVSEKPSRETKHKLSWMVKPGEMVVIVTNEKVNVPNNLLGLVFGTNNMMMKGLLIVNPGIITCGHAREVTFYAINFSKINLLLSEGDAFARIAFLRSGENVVNPRNLTSDAHLDAAVTARERFYQDFEGYFHSLVSPRISKYIRNIVIGLLIGTIAFGAIVSVISVLSPIIAERMQSVPQLRQEVTQLKAELLDIKEHIVLLTPDGTKETGKSLSPKKNDQNSVLFGPPCKPALDSDRRNGEQEK